MAGKKQVTLTTAAFDAKLEALKALDNQLAALKGTAAEWNKKALEATATGPVGGDVFALAFDLLTDVNMASVEKALTEALELLKVQRGEAMTAWIKAHRTDNDSTTALREQRNTLATEAEAMRSVFGQMGVELPEVPKAPSSRSATGSGTSGTKSKGIQFYALRGSEASRYDLSETNNTLAGVAWYVFKQAPTEDVKAALKAAGWDGTLTTPGKFGPITLTGKKGEATAIVGWDVVSADEAKPTETDDEVKDDEEVKADA